MENPTSSRILIVGAGLGGLTLAHGLKNNNIPFIIFERDTSSDFRAQGYRIRVNGDGADALKRNLDPKLFDLFERTCAEMRPGMTRMNAVDGSVIMSRPDGDPARDLVSNKELGPYTVDRTTLRSLLLLGLEDYVVYGKEFDRYEITSDGVTVHFRDGSLEKGELLVGADGVRSKIRKQYLPAYQLVDTEGRCVYGKTPITAETLEKFPSEAMKSITVISDRRQEIPLILFLEPVRFKSDPAVESEGKLRSVKDYVYWVLLSRKATFGLDDTELLTLSGQAAAQLTLKFTEEWNPAVRSILELQDESQASALRISSARPDILVWKPSANITLIGDAIHAMSPTGGVGANTALRDAVNLCQAIIEGGITAESIGRYEEQMRVYAGKAIEGSQMGGKMMYNQAPLSECKPIEL